MNPTPVHLVDQRLAARRLAALGPQHVLVMYAGAVAVPLIVAPRWSQQMSHALQPLLESGILLTAVSALPLNLYFNGADGGAEEVLAAAKLAEAH